jgi:hypothetical protein
VRVRRQQPGLEHAVVEAAGDLSAISNELNDKAHLSLAQQRLDRAHDSELAADLQPIADLERLVTAQMTGRDHLVAARSS